MNYLLLLLLLPVCIVGCADTTVAPPNAPTGRILYTEGDPATLEYRIVSIAPDGGDPRTIVRDARLIDVANGTMLFARSHPGKNLPDSVVVTDTYGFNGQTLSHISGVYPALLPNGHIVVYDFDETILLRDLISHREWTLEIGGCGCALVFAPDSRHFLYRPGTERDRWIVADITDPGARDTIAVPGGSIAQAAWSPDASRLIVKAVDSARHASYYTVDRDGRNLSAITGGDQYHPTSEKIVWSPNGTTIAFVDNEKLWMMSPNGKDLRQITNDSLRVTGDVAWSKAGDRIMYTALGSRARDLWVFDLSTSSERRLAHTEDHGDWDL